MENKKLSNSVKKIQEYLTTEASYTDLVESAALAQTQLINVMDSLGNLPRVDRPLTDEIADFFYLAMNAIRLLRPFDPTLSGNEG